MSETPLADSLNPEVARELIAGLLAHDDEVDVETLVRQVCALLPGDVAAAIFEINGGRRRFALILRSDAVYKIELQPASGTAADRTDDPYARPHRPIRIAVTRTRLHEDACSARLVEEVMERHETNAGHRIEEIATRQRTWALAVPGIDRPMHFTTEERLASRSWRRDSASERLSAKWEVVEPEIEMREGFAREFAKLSGWAAPSLDELRTELASELRR
jgi:hypothetical protein